MQAPLWRCAGRWTVVLETITPSIPLTAPTASAISLTPRVSRSGDILRTSLVRRVDDAAASSRARTTLRNKCTSKSRCCKPLSSGDSIRRKKEDSSKSTVTHRRPGVLGLETLTTSTSAYGANAWTPATKSSGDCCGLSLFFPRLIARSRPCRKEAQDSPVVDGKAGRRARRRERTDISPCEGKP